jgi:hypothetical protein
MFIPGTASPDWDVVAYGGSAAGGGGGAAAGASGQVQWNNAGAFGASANLTWDNTNTRLGIGVASPGVTLDVQTSGAIALRLRNSSATTNNTQFRYYGGAAAADIWAIGPDIVLANGSNNLQFVSLATNQSILTLGQTTGNVGIGNGNPQSTLVITKVPSGIAPNSGSQLFVENSGAAAYVETACAAVGNSCGYLFSSGGGLTSYIIDLNTTWQFVSSARPLIFNIGGSERMRITTGGNIGLGVTNPTHQLELSTDSAYKATTNTWQIPSDIRLKENVKRFAGDMEIIRRLDPIVAEYNGKAGTPRGARVVSFDAAKLREILPQAVSSARGKLDPEDEQETDILGVNTHEIFYHMLRAVQQIDNRLSELEKK